MGSTQVRVIQVLVAEVNGQVGNSPPKPSSSTDEGIWNYLKRVELANVCCHDLDEVQAALIRARERLRHKREIIRACSRQCGYLV